MTFPSNSGNINGGYYCGRRSVDKIKELKLERMDIRAIGRTLIR